MDLKETARKIRINIIKTVGKAKSGHPGGSLSGVEILTYLYFKEMKIDPENPNWEERDRFVLSKGHATPLLYSTLAERGYFDKKELDSFRKYGCCLQGHPDMNLVAGVDMTTGSLGQGISASVGIALASKLNKRDSSVFVLIGDGETQEGIVWEAAMAASNYKLDNLIVFLDNNGLQIDGRNEDVMNIEPIDEKFKAFGWNVIKIDGHDFDDISAAVKTAKNCKGQPSMIIAKTVKGKGVSFMEDKAEWHGKAPNEEQIKEAIEELGGEL